MTSTGVFETNLISTSVILFKGLYQDAQQVSLYH